MFVKGIVAGACPISVLCAFSRIVMTLPVCIIFLFKKQ